MSTFHGCCHQGCGECRLRPNVPWRLPRRRSRVYHATTPARAQDAEVAMDDGGQIGDARVVSKQPLVAQHFPANQLIPLSSLLPVIFHKPTGMVERRAINSSRRLPMVLDNFETITNAEKSRRRRDSQVSREDIQGFHADNLDRSRSSETRQKRIKMLLTTRAQCRRVKEELRPRAHPRSHHPTIFPGCQAPTNQPANRHPPSRLNFGHVQNAHAFSDRPACPA